MQQYQYTIMNIFRQVNDGAQIIFIEGNADVLIWMNASHIS